jgi:MazG family protein
VRRNKSAHRSILACAANIVGNTKGDARNWQDVSHSCLTRLKAYDMEQTKRLLEVMAKLRDPVDGCDWDLEQTFETIAPYTIEEAYEVADAIDKGDVDSIKEELGDLLFQVVFQSQVAVDNGLFDFEAVAKSIADKMIHRHPHVFGDKKFTREELKAHWEKSKADERAKRATQNVSALDGVALPLPALTRAEKIQSRAARVGFDWTSLQPVLGKLDEELAELRSALAQSDASSAEGSSGAGLPRARTAQQTAERTAEQAKGQTQDQVKEQAKEQAKEQIEEELGDLLFSVTNVARHIKVDPELALRKATAKFERRFRYVEDAIAADGLAMDSASEELLDKYWRLAKQQQS